MPAMTLNDGTQWMPTDEQIAKWVAAYQAINVQSELLAASAWLDSNPTRRKTKRGIARFCNSWLSRAQDKGGSGMAKSKTRGASVSTREMTMTQDLTHNFIDCPRIAAHFKEKFGEVFDG